MPQRLSSEERKIQIVRAALDLLGTVSVDRLTTRLVASAVGVSQPALFKHFDSRDAILEAVMEHVRTSLEDSVRDVFASGSGARETVLGLLTGLFRFAEANPGAPRLLFFDAATTGDEALPSLHRPLLLVVSRQTTLVTELVRSEIERGSLPGEVDPARAGELFVAMLQGELLRWHLDSHARGLLDRAPGLVDFWWAGLKAGQPVVTGGVAPAQPAKRHALLELDVRPLLKEGVDPFEAILAALETLLPEGTLVLIAPFRPDPLISVLEGRGFLVNPGEPFEGLFTIAITRNAESDAPTKAARTVLDLRDLPMPEPLEAVLVAAENLEPGNFTLARLPRFPRMLIPMLEERGLTWECFEEPNRSVFLHFARPSR